MPYIDKAQAKEYWKTKKREQRMSNPVNVQPYVQPKVDPNLPLYWYTTTDGVTKRIELNSVPEGCKVLSDGQVWRPGNSGYHG